MKKIVVATALLAASAPSFAAPLLALPSLNGLHQTLGSLAANGGFLKNGTVLEGSKTLGGLTYFLLDAGNVYVGSTLGGLPIFKSTPLPGLLLKIRENVRNGNG